MLFTRLEPASCPFPALGLAGHGRTALAAAEGVSASSTQLRIRPFSPPRCAEMEEGTARPQNRVKTCSGASVKTHFSASASPDCWTPLAAAEGVKAVPHHREVSRGRSDAALARNGACLGAELIEQCARCRRVARAWRRCSTALRE